MATKKEQEVAPVEEAKLPAEFLQEIEQDAGVGVSNMGMDDVAVPYLYVLQSNSPQVNLDHELYVKDAKPGMFFNNVSGEIFDGRETGLMIIPCAYERKYVEWIDRDSGGGGYVADHDIDSGILSECKQDDKKKWRLGKDHIIIETAYHYVYFKNPNTGRWEEIIIPMKGSFLKKSRRFNKSLMATFIPGTNKQAPRWLYPYLLKTVKESDGTNTWSNIELFQQPDPVTIDQYRAAKKFAELMAQGLIKRSKETMADAAVGATGPADNRPKDSKDLDDEMPF